MCARPQRDAFDPRKTRPPTPPPAACPCPGMRVRELTGDMQLTRREMDETQMIVTTPEKWDVITRKGVEAAVVAAVKLLIIDEVHLLNDERGPVIETLVARTTRQVCMLGRAAAPKKGGPWSVRRAMRCTRSTPPRSPGRRWADQTFCPLLPPLRSQVEATQSMIRVVGLSATLPNHKDVAAFLGVSLQSGEPAWVGRAPAFGALGCRTGGGGIGSFNRKAHPGTSSPAAPGCFYFDASYRPVPLEMQFVGISEKNFALRNAIMDDVAYEKVGMGFGVV